MVGEAPFGVERFHAAVLLFCCLFAVGIMDLCWLLSTRGSAPPSFNSTQALTDPANSGKVIPAASGEEGK